MVTAIKNKGSIAIVAVLFVLPLLYVQANHIANMYVVEDTVSILQSATDGWARLANAVDNSNSARANSIAFPVENTAPGSNPIIDPRFSALELFAARDLVVSKPEMVSILDASDFPRLQKKMQIKQNSEGLTEVYVHHLQVTGYMYSDLKNEGMFFLTKVPGSRVKELIGLLEGEQLVTLPSSYKGDRVEYEQLGVLDSYTVSITFYPKET